MTTNVTLDVLATVVVAIARDQALGYVHTAWAVLLQLIRCVLLALMMALSPSDPGLTANPAAIAPEIEQIPAGQSPPALERQLGETRRALAATIERLFR